MTLSSLNSTLRTRLEPLVSVCVTCSSLCGQIADGVFEHIDDACRECFGTTGPCAYSQQHGVHAYRVRASHLTVTCAQAAPAECAWCHRVLDAAAEPCPDHRAPCCGCCPDLR